MVEDLSLLVLQSIPFWWDLATDSAQVSQQAVFQVAAAWTDPSEAVASSQAASCQEATASYAYLKILATRCWSTLSTLVFKTRKSLANQRKKSGDARTTDKMVYGQTATNPAHGWPSCSRKSGVWAKCGVFRRTRLARLSSIFAVLRNPHSQHYVPTSIIKSAISVFSDIITHVAKLSFKAGTWQTKFKNAHFTPLFKKKIHLKSRLAFKVQPDILSKHLQDYWEIISCTPRTLHSLFSELPSPLVSIPKTSPHQVFATQPTRFHLSRRR